ncbi:reverse transcriptase [Plakobranchus ocellatus]|uniref:Reverse transcriptase n=1 Tax=Plakobranchus ocellatus TaxID=259542 RepID=A0AAV3YNF8_9GAST|nr:reverse transcriptase [Plakobranchus ocellatus]
MSLLKAFMDDTTTLCSKENETRRMLVRLDTQMNWSRKSFKTKKSRSLSIRKGKLNKDVFFKVASQDTPTTTQEPAKSLIRWYNSFLKDTKRGSEGLEQASVGLHAIEKGG